ncbi:MAG: hypothetical protein ACC645_04345 [Pirellulales bacterium]
MMRMRRCNVVVMLATLALFTTRSAAFEIAVVLDEPMAPPDWALLERELLRAQTSACQEFFAKYFDERGYLLCVERWGGDDGPDDAIENINYWPILHALGAPDVIRQMVDKAWEGHLRQYTEAKTVQVPMARDGMYYKEFPVMMDWLHNGEGLTVFNVKGLSDPCNLRYRQRVKRFAGFYMNEDPQAPNYDPQHKIIRSMFNGSRGPLLRKATGLDWAGDPIEVAGRFQLRHHEDNYEQMVAHFKDYNDIVGDHPQNMSATSLALNAYMLTGDKKYKAWLLEYVDAWLERTEKNGQIIPTNIGLDGTIGGAADGKWYGGAYGWAFTVQVPQTGEYVHRNTHHLGLIGFGNAYMVTGDDRYLEVWRRMTDTINKNGRMIDGQMMVPTMYGDDGWYAYRPHKYQTGALEIYYWSMDPKDRQRVPANGWLDFLDGQNRAYPAASLQAEFSALREKVQEMRSDATTPDTRLSDDPMPYNPARVGSLVQLMLGGLAQGGGRVLNASVRYFDPERRRAGIPTDVAALVQKMTADSVTLTLVNINQVEPRTLIVQTGAYGEHQCLSVTLRGTTVPIDRPYFKVKLDPGSGGELTIQTDRYANPPTLVFPWDRVNAN